MSRHDLPTHVGEPGCGPSDQFAWELMNRRHAAEHALLFKFYTGPGLPTHVQDPQHGGAPSVSTERHTPVAGAFWADLDATVVWALGPDRGLGPPACSGLGFPGSEFDRGASLEDLWNVVAQYPSPGFRPGPPYFASDRHPYTHPLGRSFFSPSNSSIS